MAVRGIKTQMMPGFKRCSRRLVAIIGALLEPADGSAFAGKWPVDRPVPLPAGNRRYCTSSSPGHLKY
jgi:hypothetical protein